MRCPVCGSRKVTKLETGSYKCNDCGFIFYPDREAIIDMRDLLTAEDLSPEEIEKIGEDIRTATEESMGQVYREDIQNVFKPAASLEDIADKYNTDEYLYGTFADIEGDVSGTVILLIPERGMAGIIKKYNTGIVLSLKRFTNEYLEEMGKILNWRIKIKNVDVVHDTMISIMNYITSEAKKKREMMLMSYEFLSSTKENYGDMIFLPTKNSLKMLGRHA